MTLTSKEIQAMRSEEYWRKRQERLVRNLEKDEATLMKKLDKYYDRQARNLEDYISRFYGAYGHDNIIEYRSLLKSLSETEKDLLYKDFNTFMDKYPQYSHLEPIRGQIYKLDRLEGLRVSMLIEQMEIAGYEQTEIEKHLLKTCDKAMLDSLNMLGFGNNFNIISPEMTKKLINKNWVGGENFSKRIWKNRQALANHLTEQFRNSVIRGDTYRQCANLLTHKFKTVSRRDAERLIRTEGTYIMNEASITPFEKEFKQYKYSAIFDQRTSEVCKALDGQVFDMDKRQPGSNFPPMHPWCRSGYEVVIPKDWLDKKLEEATGVNPQEIDPGKILPKDVKESSFDSLDTIVTKLKGAMTETNYKKYCSLIEKHQNKNYNRLYREHIPKLRGIIKPKRKEGCYFNPKLEIVKIRVEGPKKVKEGIDKFGTVAHELGHVLDHYADVSKLTFNEIDALVRLTTDKYHGLERNVSTSDMFLTAIRKDKKKLQEIGFDELKMKLISDDASAGVQDFIDGTFIGKDYRINWGHGEDYYTRKYNRYERSVNIIPEEINLNGNLKINSDNLHIYVRDQETASEAWANIMSADINNGKALEYVKEYLPNSYKAMKDILEVIK